MAKLGEQFNVDDMPQEEGGFEPLPAGDYTATITESSLNDTKAGTGQYIKLRMDITGPSHEGRVVFANLNIRNPTQKAEEIGRQQLGTIMKAIGLSALQDTDELIGGSVAIKVAIRKSEEWGDQNDVRSFKAVSGGIPSQPSQSAPQQPEPQKPAGGNQPPWMRG
jgi:hypothetical protein